MSDHDATDDTAANPTGPSRRRRPATIQEAKALAHPLRARILRLCGQQELTNKQLADRLERDPASIYYHVRLLVDAGLLEPATVRTGTSGALEKPYRSSGASWWLSTVTDDGDVHPAMASLAALDEELTEAGPESIATLTRFSLHLSDHDLDELATRIQSILDEYVETEDQRPDQPLHGGVFLLHRQAP